MAATVALPFSMIAGLVASGAPLALGILVAVMNLRAVAVNRQIAAMNLETATLNAETARLNFARVAEERGAEHARNGVSRLPSADEGVEPAA